MALSKIPDLTYSYKGQEYTFVDQLEVCLKELECPICRSIVSEPVQTSCGHLFCGECHNELGSGRTPCSTECPVCKQEHTAMEDKFNDRRVKNLKVRCINHREGCEWVGCLKDEGQHRKKQDGCAYEEIPCAHGCSVTIRRKDQQTHSVSCLMRTHKCKYCHEDGPYQCITGEHLETCRRYPVQCPNGCKEKLPREEVLSEVKLKEQLSAMEKKLQVERQRAQQLERDNKANTERIHQLEWDAEDKEKQLCNLQKDTKTKAQHIQYLERDTGIKAQRICALERDAVTKAQLERHNKANTERIHQLERDTEAKAKQLCNLQRDTETKAQRIQYLEMDAQTKTETIARLTEAEERLKKKVSQLDMIVHILDTLLISFMLLVYLIMSTFK